MGKLCLHQLYEIECRLDLRGSYFIRPCLIMTLGKLLWKVGRIDWMWLRRCHCLSFAAKFVKQKTHSTLGMGKQFTRAWFGSQQLNSFIYSRFDITNRLSHQAPPCDKSGLNGCKCFVSWICHGSGCLGAVGRMLANMLETLSSSSIARTAVVYV